VGGVAEVIWEPSEALAGGKDEGARPLAQGGVECELEPGGRSCGEWAVVDGAWGVGVVWGRGREGGSGRGAGRGGGPPFASADARTPSPFCVGMSIHVVVLPGGSRGVTALHA
jgi:hypothetical protein